MPALESAPAPITGPQLREGGRRLMLDAAFATIVGTLNSGVVLVASRQHVPVYDSEYRPPSADVS